jgi:NADPH-ferrihemoprotein reductase
MSTIIPQHWVLPNTYVAAQSLQSASLDDVVAMAVLAILSAVYLGRGTLWDRPDPHLYKMYERPQEKMGSKSMATVSRDVSERMQQMVSNVSVIVSSNVG